MPADALTALRILARLFSRGKVGVIEDVDVATRNDFRATSTSLLDWCTLSYSCSGIAEVQGSALCFDESAAVGACS